MIILSCDPGKTGAVSVFRDGSFLEAIPVCTWGYGSGIQVKPMMAMLNYHAGPLLKKRLGDEPVYGCMEFVHAMPRQGVSSTFSFGKTTGVLFALLELLCTSPIREVRPTDWKKHFNLQKTEKHAAVELALEMEPDLLACAEDIYSKTPNKQIQSGIADSYLIGRYFMEVLNSEQ